MSFCFYQKQMFSIYNSFGSKMTYNEIMAFDLTYKHQQPRAATH